MPRMTQAEYAAYLARAGQSTSAPDDAVPAESALHNDILSECRRRGWLVFHGSMAHKTFRTPGEPDCIVLADNSRTFLIELKTRTGKLSPDQQAVAAWAAKLGHTVHVVRSLKDFLDITK